MRQQLVLGIRNEAAGVILFHVILFIAYDNVCVLDVVEKVARTSSPEVAIVVVAIAVTIVVVIGSEYVCIFTA